MYTGTNITREGLVFGYDADDRSTRFYPGEPTSNVANGIVLGFSGARWTDVTSSTYPSGLNFEPHDVWKRISNNNYWGYVSNFTSSPALNKIYTISFWYYLENGYDGTDVYSAFTGKLVDVSSSSYSVLTTSLNNTFSTSVKGKWLYGQETIQITIEPFQYVYFSAWGGGTVEAGKDCYIANFQFEEKSHATQFTPTSRSTTQGLLDLTGNNTIDLTNMSFDDTAHPYFEGSQYLVSPVSSIFNFNTSDFSIECWVFMDTDMSTSGIYHSVMNIGTTYDGSETFRLAIWRSGLYPGAFYNTYGGSPIFGTDGSGGGYTGASYSGINRWTHVVMDRSSTTCNFYLNGELWASRNTPTIPNSSNLISVGTVNELYLIGKVPIVKIYNRALTQQEITQNFNAYRHRFGI